MNFRAGAWASWAGGWVRDGVGDSIDGMDRFREQLLSALVFAEAGRWDDAHRIAQAHESEPLADWLHAVVHKVEGDVGNSRYWYRRAGRPDHSETDTATELGEIRKAIEAAPDTRDASPRE
jgi:hypothetical protein